MPLIIQTALELGFLYALVAMALFLSYRILDIADLTTDGCFILGGAVSVTAAIAGHPILGIPLAMLAGGVCAAGDRALRSVAALALQKQFLTFTAAQSAHRTGISSHLSMHLLIAVRRVFSWEDGIRCGGSGSRL